MPQFMILATDYKDEQALERRMNAREAHLQRMKTEKEKGIFITGGAKLNEHGIMYGSMLIVEMSNKGAVQQWLETDPYITGKVWETVEILPFKIANV